MGSESETPVKLPAIDFTNLGLKPGTLEWDLVKRQVRQALEEYGSFEASFDEIPLDLREAMLGALEELFDLPLEAKIRNVSETPYHGYIGQHPKVPLFESLGFEDSNDIERIEAQTRAIWPEGNTSFSKTIQSFSKKLSELDQMIRRMILESFDLGKYMDEHFNSTDYIFRVMKYQGPKSTETKLGLGSHKDKDMVTILYQINEVDGLGVQSKDGEWIDLKPSKDSYIVMIGDSLHAWLNGRLHSPYHRVMLTGNRARYSLGLFSVPRGGYLIKAPEELIDEAHPLLYKPFDYVEFLRFPETGQEANPTLKAYCGV